jgi:hypothetical protein
MRDDILGSVCFPLMALIEHAAVTTGGTCYILDCRGPAFELAPGPWDAAALALPPALPQRFLLCL